MTLRIGEKQKRKEFRMDLLNTYYTCMEFSNNKKIELELTQCRLYAVDENLFLNSSYYHQDQLFLQQPNKCIMKVQEFYPEINEKLTCFFCEHYITCIIYFLLGNYAFFYLSSQYLIAFPYKCCLHLTTEIENADKCHPQLSPLSSFTKVPKL